jgi:linoleate 10R-lipoxygenase
MKDSLTKQDIADRYTFERPTPDRLPVVLNTFQAIKTVFNDPTRFKAVYDLKKLGNGYGFILAMDDKAPCVVISCLSINASVLRIPPQA